jgi:hypothetical protein
MTLAEFGESRFQEGRTISMKFDGLNKAIAEALKAFAFHRLRDGSFLYHECMRGAVFLRSPLSRVGVRNPPLM